MFEVSGTAVAHAETLNTAAHIAEAASRNRFLFAVALSLAAIGYTVIHLRNAFTRHQEQQLRSFSSLYAHMTRSRIAALKLFLSYQDEESVKHPEMLRPAAKAAQQLEGHAPGAASGDFRSDKEGLSLQARLTHKLGCSGRIGAGNADTPGS
ncbi:hypothetical protein [Mesorhizobium sp. J18]|uniref:hypothetical protein n=1 Tax=Mesorhizobium sp. J18 TaxID=935263 RepID=UPI0016496EB9|nr:hypothetical protein [Mesorhizobium sp. J18]